MTWTLGTFDGIQTSYLYSIWGRRLAEFPGRFVRFSSDGQSLIVRDGEQNRIYDLSGHELEASQVSEDMNSGLVAGQALNLLLLERRLQVSRNEVILGSPDQIRGLGCDSQLLLTVDSTGSRCPRISF